MLNILLVISMVLVLFMVSPMDVWGDTWKVQIPSGAAEPQFPSHYIPQEITVRINDIVEWSNGDAEYHTVTSGSLELGRTNFFDSGLIKPGGKFNHKFGEKELGENLYFCTIHPWLVGIVNVANFEEGFKIFHNVGKEVSETTYDIEYKVQRSLSNVKVDKTKNMLIFNFAGKIDDDTFIVKLSKELIQDPNLILVNNKKIANYQMVEKDNLLILSIPLSGTSNEVKISGTAVLTSAVSKPPLITDQIFASVDKRSYYSGEKITVSGEIKNPDKINEVAIQITSPSNKIIFRESIPFISDSKFSREIQTKGLFEEFGKYELKILGDDSKTLIKSFDYVLKKGEQPSPKKQMSMNVAPENIICNEGLQLMKKVSDGAGVCLKKTSVEVLLNRGWVTTF